MNESIKLKVWPLNVKNRVFYFHGKIETIRVHNTKDTNTFDTFLSLNGKGSYLSKLKKLVQ